MFGVGIDKGALSFLRVREVRKILDVFEFFPGNYSQRSRK